MKSMAKVLMVLALAAVILMPGVASAFLMVDDFTSVKDGISDPPAYYWSLTPPATPVNTTNSVTKSETGLSDVLGGSRFTTAYTIPFWRTSPTPAQWVNGGVSVDVWTGADAGRTGFLFLSSAFTGTGAFELRYDGGGSGLNADFANGTAINAVFNSDHLGFGKDTIMRLTLTDAVGHSAAVTHTWSPPAQNPSDYLNESFLLSAFTGVDLHHISSLKLYYEGDRANDMTLDSISTDASAVPLPPSVLLLGTGILGLVGLGWRRRKTEA